MGVRAEPKCTQPWTSAYFMTWDVSGHHESTTECRRPAAAALAWASGPWTQGVPSISMRLCHIGLECFWGRNQDLSHPCRSTPLQQSVNCLGLKTNMNPFHPHSSRSNTAAELGDEDSDMEKRSKVEVVGAVLTPRWQFTGKAITAEQHHCGTPLRQTAGKEKRQLSPLNCETQTKVEGTQSKLIPTHTADTQLSLRGTWNKKIWAFRTHLFSHSYSS